MGTAAAAGQARERVSLVTENAQGVRSLYVAYPYGWGEEGSV